MKKKIQHNVSCWLLGWCLALMTLGQFLVLSEQFTHGSETVPDSSAHPFDQRPLQTQWKRELPPLQSDISSKTVDTCQFISDYLRVETIFLPIMYTPIVSHFPHPPFEPRDPSIS